MKKKNKIFSSLLATGLGVTAIAASLPMLTSCSSGGGHTVKRVEYNVETKTTTTYAAGAPEVHPIKVFPANLNEQAQADVQNFQRDLTVGDVQYDFNRALTDFYESYEAKSGKTEIEIENIEVLSKNDDGSFQLKVWYELDYDNYMITPRDKDVVEPKEIKWTPKLTTLTKTDVDEIIATVRGFGQEDEANGMDLEDIRELFLGDQDDPNDYDFDDDDDDDIGIFDQLGRINKEYENQSSIIAYSLRISDLFNEITGGKTYSIISRAGATTPDKNTEFKIPSLSLNSGGSVVLVPNESPSFKFTSILEGKTYSEVFSSDRDLSFTDQTNAAVLDKVFTGVDQTWKDSVDTIHVDVTKGTLIVKYKDTSKPWEEVVIARQWGLNPAA